MRVLPLLGVALMALAGALAAHAQEVQVSSSVNKRSLRVGDTLTFTLRVEGVGLVPQPVLPPLDGFKQSGQYQTVENTPAGKVLLFHYLLSPTRAGRIAVPSFQMTVGGQARSVPGFSVAVETGPPQPAGVAPGVARPLRADDFVLLGELDASRATVGQGVIYTLHLLTKPSVRRLAITASPDFGGFQRVEDPGASGSQVRQRRYRDATYLDQVLRRYVLFPLQAGELKVGDFQIALTVEAGDYPPVVQEVPLRGGSASLRVVAPPPPPPGFTGCVGRFTFTSDLPSAGDHPGGKPFSVVYRVEGEGFLPQNPIGWPETPLFERYPPSVTDRSAFEGGSYRVRREITVAYIPKVAGPAELPPARLVVLEPESGRYASLEAGGLKLTVTEAEGSSSATDATLAPLLPLPRPSPPAPASMPLGRFLTLLAAPFAGSLLLWLGLFLRERLLGDPSKARRRRLRRSVVRELGRARRSTDTRKHEAFHLHLTRALAAHLELSLGKPAEGLTRPQLRAALAESGWEEGSVRRVTQLLEELEAARYAPGQPVLRDLQARFAVAAKIVEEGP